MKRSPLNRYTPLARGTKTLKRSPMNKVSTKAKTRKRRQAEQYKDAHGLTFADVNGLLRPVGQWPFIEDVEDAGVVDRFRQRFMSSGWGYCWLCDKWRILDAAHIVPRSDERCNLAAFCSSLPHHGYDDSCHTLTEKNWAMLPEVLKAKWEHDREHTSWMPIAIRRRQLFTFTTLD